MVATGRVLNDITIVKGAAKTWNFQVKKKDGTALDCTGATMYFTAREKYGATTAAILKSTNVGTEMEWTDEATGTGKLHLVPADTKDRPVGKLVYDMWIKLPSGKPYPVIKKSSLEIEWNVTVITD